MQKNLLIILLISHTLNGSTFLVFGGKTGWIGQKIVNLLKANGHLVHCASSRLENRQDILNEINQFSPDFIINTAGIIGKPNIDWCEDNKEETIRINVLGTLNLIDVAFLQNIHVTNISTGCIYEYDEKHPKGSKGFKEFEEPNFKGSFYSRTKILLEKLILEYPNVLNLRVKMPLAYELNKGFLRIINLKKVINVPNSLCVLEDLLPIAIDMTLKKTKGNFNFVNPGSISHNELLDLYKEHYNPEFTYTNFTLEEHDKMLKARRSNCTLDPEKLLTLYPNIPNIRDSLIKIFKTIKIENDKK